MEKSEQKKIIGRLIDASVLIGRKGRTVMEPGYIYAPWTPMVGIKRNIMFVKEWLAKKRIEEEQTKAYGIDVEEELTRLLSKHLAEEIEKEKNINNSWINKNIRGLD